MYKEDLRDMIEIQIRLEKTAAEKIEELEDVTPNLAAKMLLAIMKSDTKKHAKILQMILDLMRQQESLIQPGGFWARETTGQVDVLVARKMFEEHVNVETKMLKHIKEEIIRANDDALKLVFKYIAEDEKRHHKIMETILKRAFGTPSIA